MNILGIIPARAGSKGIKNKNIKKINGLPLINYVFKNAKKVKLINHLILSTDSKKIANIGKKIGMEVPFIRPKKLAQDSSSQIQTINHAIQQAEKIYSKRFEIIILLQPTCPLTQSYHIKKAINLIRYKKFDSIGSATLLKDGHPVFHLKKIKNKFIRLNPKLKGIDSRHKLKKLYRACGNIYAIKRNVFFKYKKLISANHSYILVEEKYAININDELDWTIAESLIKKNYAIK